MFSTSYTFSNRKVGLNWLTRFELFDALRLEFKLPALLLPAPQVLFAFKLTELNEEELAAAVVFEVDADEENDGDGARPF